MTDEQIVEFLNRAAKAADGTGPQFTIMTAADVTRCYRAIIQRFVELRAMAAEYDALKKAVDPTWDDARVEHFVMLAEKGRRALEGNR